MITASVTAATPEELSAHADFLREDGQSLLAIDTYNYAIVQFQEQKEYDKMIGALTGRLLCWKHLFYKTQAKVYAIFVQKEAEGMLEIAKTYHVTNRMHLIHFLNATAALLFEDYVTAQKEYESALAAYPTDSAEVGDWTAHLGEAMYRNGKKEEGKQKILEGVKIIEERSSQIDSFLRNVWVSGAYLRLAKLLRNDDPAESQKYLKMAQEIIDGDPRLVIRKQQLDTYLKTL